MKKLMMVLAATTMAVAPLATASAEAAPRYKSEKTVKVKKGKNNTRAVVTKRTTVQPRYAQKVQKQQTRKWSKGQRFDRRYAVNYMVVNNPRAYGLYNAPRGYQWVRSNRDLVLIRTSNNYISRVIYSAIR